MQDTKLFETILGITTPWHVARVTLKPEDERVDVWLEHEPTRWPCPDCGETVPAFDHAAERTWRHLDTCQFQTHLHAKIPRVQCPAHGVKQVRVPWAEPRSRFTVLLERLIIDLILQCSTVKGACEIAGVSWDEAWGVMSRAVARGHARKAARPITYIGVDEKAFRKGHRYHTIVCDLQRATVEFVDAESQSWARVGDQRSVAGLVDLPSPGGREAVLHALVWLGDPLAARAREAGGEDVEAASRRGAPLCHASDHEWRSRRSQQQDHEHQAKGRRLPQPVTLHDGDLFSLWRARPLPTLNPEGP